MTIALKANAAGTQGEIQLNGNPVAEFRANAVNFPGLAQSLTPNGYVKLPGGLIVQWGEGTTNASGIATVTFPIPFTTACLQTFATGATPVRIMTAAGPFAPNSAAFYSHNDSGIGAAADFRWLAVGY